MGRDRKEFEKFELDLIGIAAAIGMMLLYAFARNNVTGPRTTFGSTKAKGMHLLLSQLEHVGGAKYVYLLLFFFLAFFTYHAIKDYKRAKKK